MKRIWPSALMSLVLLFSLSTTGCRSSGANPPAATTAAAAASAPAGSEQFIAVPAPAWQYTQASRVGPSWPKAQAPQDVWQSEPPALPAKRSVKFVAQARFDAPALPAGAKYWKLKIKWPDTTRGTVYLNGMDIPTALAGMYYTVIPAIEPGLVHKGSNEIAVRAEASSEKARPQAPLSMRLSPMYPSELSFDIQPMLGASGEDFFTVSARTTMPAKVTLEVTRDGRSIRKASSQGMFHQFRVEGLKPGTYQYAMAATLGGWSKGPIVASRTGKLEVGPLPPTMRFVALGDSRSDPAKWRQVMESVAAYSPRYIIHSGDLVSNGREYDLWTHDFTTPAAEVLGAIPFYPVWGNHEGNASILDKLFLLPGPANDHWAQQRGDVLLIGIDGGVKDGQGWKPGTPLYHWLEETLKSSPAKYIFLTTHYPPYSSSSHGRLKADGLPSEQTMRVMRQSVVPLLAKYHAQAIICGHDHCYERSELDNGLTVLITGGAGAPLYPKAKDAEVRNPYGKVFTTSLNYLVFDVSPQEVRMLALTPEGQQLDSRTWKPRAVVGPAAAETASEPAISGAAK